MFKVTDEDVKELIKKECEVAVEKGIFASEHEFSSVLNEELDEVADEYEKMNKDYDKVWKHIKDDYKHIDICDDCDELKKHAINCIKELLQVCAVIDKRDNYGFEKSGRDVRFHDDEGNELDGIVHVLHCSNCGAEIEYKVPSDIKEKSAISDEMINREGSDFDDNIVKTYSY